MAIVLRSEWLRQILSSRKRCLVANTTFFAFFVLSFRSRLRKRSKLGGAAHRRLKANREENLLKYAGFMYPYL